MAVDLGDDGGAVAPGPFVGSEGFQFVLVQLREQLDDLEDPQLVVVGDLVCGGRSGRRGRSGYGDRVTARWSRWREQQKDFPSSN